MLGLGRRLGRGLETGVLALGSVAQSSSLSMLTRTKNSVQECLPQGLECCVLFTHFCTASSAS